MKTSGRVLGVADQALSSVTNVAITVFAASALEPTAFGGFALAFAFYLALVGMARSLATEPLLIRPGASDGEALRAAVGAMAALGLAAAAVCGCVGLISGGTVGRPLLAGAAFLPLLFVQDGWRYGAFASGRPPRALVVDVVWLGVQIPGVALLLVSDSREPAAFMAVWAASGAVSAVVGAVQSGLLPSITRGVRWLRANSDLGGPFLAEFLAAGAAVYAGLWLLGLVSGLAAVGAVRVAQTIFGPINVLYAGIYLTLVPEGARQAKGDRAQVNRSMQRISAVLLATSAVATVAALAIPGGVGEGLFGDTWDLARPVLLPMGLTLCGSAVMAGALAGLRSLAAARLTLRTRVATIPLTLVGPVLGALVADEVGFTAGLALGTWAAAALWWSAFKAGLSQPAPPVPSPPRRTRQVPEQLQKRVGGAVPRELGGTPGPGRPEPSPEIGI